MGKDMFVTSGLCKIREQIAASSRKQGSDTAERSSAQLSSPGGDVPSFASSSASSSASAGNSVAGAQYDFEAFSPETKRALILREEEFERLRKEALFRLHELELLSGKNKEYAQSVLEKCESAEKMISRLRESAGQLPALDRTQESYRKLLAENSRALDRVRMEILDVKSLLPADPDQKGPSGKGGNLFAELDSVTFSQILRIAFAFSLPVIVTLCICALLVGIMMLLTFRVGL